MATELSYLLITPYSLMKSRTGGIMARLLSRSDIELVGAQILAFTRDLVEKYAESLEATIPDAERAKLLADYVRENFTERDDGKKERVLMLLFKGENACAKLAAITGKLSAPVSRDLLTGETIRDTYADMVKDKDDPGVIRYFEPAVLTPQSTFAATDKLRFFANFAAASSNIVENVVGVQDGDERTLVIIKPDNWRLPSSRPGNIIDVLSRAGLRIVGCKMYRMSVANALEFYGPVQDVLRERFAPVIGAKAKSVLEKEFNLTLPESSLEALTNVVGCRSTSEQFARLIEFMSGRNPETCSESEISEPGLVKCLILIYEGKNAVSKIRTVLGPTDPTKAPSGTVRRDFGSDIMINTAHASDSRESYESESRIVGIEYNDLSKQIYDYLESPST